jgi:Vacuolar protein 14 C-terminal Fig4p binding
MNVNMLIKLAQLTKLMDMPHYASMRMQLLRPTKHPHLINALKGMIMLLPQGKAFDSLKNRLECSSLVFECKEAPAIKNDIDADISKYVTLVLEENGNLFSGLEKAKLMDYLD